MAGGLATGSARHDSYIVSNADTVAAEDEPAWKAYLAMVPATIRKYGGHYLVRGGAIDVIEGEWSPHALVIVAFPDKEAALRWYNSPEYAEGLKIRAGSGLQRGLLCVEGAEDADPGWGQ